MSNTLLTNDSITNESLSVLENEMVFSKLVNRPVDKMFGNEDNQEGDSVKIRLPDRGTYRSGATFTPDDITERSVTVTLAQGGADCNFTSKELALDIAQFSERVLKPRIVTIANEIDRQGLALYSNIASQVGTAGTSPNASSFILDGGVVLDDHSVPNDGKRYALLSPKHNASMVGGLQGVFNPQAVIGDQYTKGLMGKDTLGFDFYKSQNTPSHTVGALGGTPLVNGTTASGATTLVTDGWTAAAADRVAVGDVFTIAGVNAVNPITGQNTGRLMQFTATAIGASSGAGAMTISISPTITSTGKFRNVSALPADNAALTFTGTASTAYSTSMLFHEEAFVMAMGQLPVVGGTDMCARKSYNGMSMRLVRAYDVNNDKLPTRLDVLFGWVTARREFACRLVG
jgi:hypothetical protein